MQTNSSENSLEKTELIRYQVKELDKIRSSYPAQSQYMSESTHDKPAAFKYGEINKPVKIELNTMNDNFKTSNLQSNNSQDDGNT